MGAAFRKHLLVQLVGALRLLGHVRQRDVELALHAGQALAVGGARGPPVLARARQPDRVPRRSVRHLAKGSRVECRVARRLQDDAATITVLPCQMRLWQP
jgi:hypothetical protein